MTAIKHRVEIRATPDKVFRAIAEQDGLAHWWTELVEAKPEIGTVGV